MMHEYTVIIGVNAITGKQQRWIYRVSGSEQSVFLRKMQDDKKYIESGRDLYAKTLKDVVQRHIIDRDEEDEFSRTSLLRKDIDPRLLRVVDCNESCDHSETSIGE